MSFYTFIKDALNHERAVARRIDQLDLLNALISERTDKVDSLSDEIKKIEERLAAIKTFYPGLSEEQAVVAYFELLKEKNAKLSEEIALKEAELKQLSEQLGIVQELNKIETTRAMLKERKRQFQEFKKNNVSLRDVIIATYEIDSDKDHTYVDGFVYFSDTTYYVKGEPETGRLYRSIDGARIIGFTSDMKVLLISTNSNTELSINTVPVLWHSLVDVCDMLDVDIRSTVVSFDFIANVRTKFNNAFYFNENSNGKWYLERKKRD